MIKETSGQLLEIGDRVKMNIETIGKGDMDGVEFTRDGQNYWRYMNQHPDEVYTITEIDGETEQPSYYLSGNMAGENWYSEELILLPKPQSNFEIIKNMTLEEMAEGLLNMVFALFEDGVPNTEEIKAWLDSEPKEE